TVRLCKDGSRVDVSLTISPIRDREGTVTGLARIARNVTQQKQVEEALRASELRFRQLADAMPQMVWAARPDGYIDYFNERWYEFTGLPRDVLGDESWMPVLHPDDVQRCRETYFRCIEAGTPYEIEYRFRDRTRGGHRWFLGRA